MFSQAVVATDLGASSEPVVGCARALRTLGVKRVALVHVLSLEHPPSSADDAAFVMQVEAFEAAGIAVTVDTPVGYPPHQIADAVTRFDADLIVMGTRGQGLFHVGFSGSVSSDVIRLSTTPVLLAPATQQPGTGDHGMCDQLLSSILVPTDFSALSDRALELACALPVAHVGVLTLVHVIESTFEALRGGREHAAREQLEDLAARAREAGIADVRIESLVGIPDRVICNRAASGAFTLTVLAPRCLDTIDQQFGSVTNAVVRECGIPMLLAPPLCERLT